ncbi:uncharacterized protein [Physcomitrium patens]|uniref:Uncharacterized protein n=1 Tax=Physcomitrium patens TaxID=3218 RepID=A0A7I4C127_PHYPA
MDPRLSCERAMFFMQYHSRSRRADRRVSYRPESHAERIIRLETSADIAACRSCHSTVGDVHSNLNQKIFNFGFFLSLDFWVPGYRFRVLPIGELMPLFICHGYACSLPNHMEKFQVYWRKISVCSLP